MNSLHLATCAANVTPMTRAEYNTMRNWALPSDECGADEGFLVEDLNSGAAPNVEGYNGYISWKPADQFKNTYRPSGFLSFGHAVELLRQGQLLARQGWNGKDQYICLVPEQDIPDTELVCREHIVIRTGPKHIATWAPSCSDALANDWALVKPTEATEGETS